MKKISKRVMKAYVRDKITSIRSCRPALRGQQMDFFEEGYGYTPVKCPKCGYEQSSSAGEYCGGCGVWLLGVS